MSRLKLNQIQKEEAVREALRQEIRVRRAVLDMTQKDLAEQINMDPCVLSRFIREPDKLTAERLRGMVRVLGLSPGTMLAFLGFDAKAIQQFKSA